MKEAMCLEICTNLNFPAELKPSNINIVHIATAVDDISDDPSTSLFSLNIPDSAPVSSWVLDKGKPKYHFIYDIRLLDGG